MTNLREAAQAVVDRWDTPLWKDVPATAVFINELRAALAEPEPTGERAYWIKELRSAYIDITLHQTEANRIADMLEADGRVPLTDAKIRDKAEDYKLTYMHGGQSYDDFDPLGFARAIEDAHGICAQTMRMEDAR